MVKGEGHTIGSVVGFSVGDVVRSAWLSFGVRWGVFGIGYKIHLPVHHEIGGKFIRIGRGFSS